MRGKNGFRDSGTPDSFHFALFVDGRSADPGRSVGGFKHTLVDGVNVLAKVCSYHVARKDGVGWAADRVTMKDNFFESFATLFRSSHHDILGRLLHASSGNVVVVHNVLGGHDVGVGTSEVSVVDASPHAHVGVQRVDHVELPRDERNGRK